MQIQRYLSRISGPLLDRIDLQVEVPALRFSELAGDEPTEPSEAIRGRVVLARERQRTRFRQHGEPLWSNSQMTPRHVRSFCAVDEVAHRRLEEAIKRRGLSARAYDRILKVARTIADLAGREAIEPRDISEAVRFRSLDRAYWNP